MRAKLDRTAAAAASTWVGLLLFAPSAQAQARPRAPSRREAPRSETCCSRPVGATVLTVLMLAIGQAHRSGRTTVLDRAGRWSERQWGLPGWAALPGVISLVALLVALVGMYWDISLHIDNGRDPGPLANPAHYLILIGLFGVFVAGFVSMVMPRERPGPSAVTITALLACAARRSAALRLCRVLAPRLPARRRVAPAFSART